MKYRWQGKEYLPRTGGAILAPNHLSLLPRERDHLASRVSLAGDSDHPGNITSERLPTAVRCLYCPNHEPTRGCSGFPPPRLGACSCGTKVSREGGKR